MVVDVAIVGGGPGGYTAAERAATEGLSVVLFEERELGGTCLNRGCIPTKALLHAAEAFAGLVGLGEQGVSVGEVSLDFAAMHDHKARVVAQLRDGIAKLMRAGKVRVVSAHATVVAPGVVEAAGTRYEARDIVIAAGSRPALPPVEGIGLEGVYTSDAFLEDGGVDVASLVIIGGGVIGMELASVYASLGRAVSVIEMADRILPTFDGDVAKRLAPAMRRRGVSIATKSQVKAIAGTPGDMRVSYVDARGRELKASGEAVLVATGRHACLEDLLAPGVGVELDRGVVTDAQGRTSAAHIWAIGDVRAGNVQLAHVAEAQGKNVIAAICGKQPPVNEGVIPSCVYTSPELAQVGLTEADAKAAGLAVSCGRALTGANGKCLVEGASAGFAKLVAREGDGRLLGAQLACPHATELIAELSLAVAQGLSVAELRGVIHPHPTVSELVLAAAEAIPLT